MVETPNSKCYIINLYATKATIWISAALHPASLKNYTVQQRTVLQSDWLQHQFKTGFIVLKINPNYHTDSNEVAVGSGKTMAFQGLTFFLVILDSQNPNTVACLSELKSDTNYLHFIVNLMSSFLIQLIHTLQSTGMINKTAISYYFTNVLLTASHTIWATNTYTYLLQVCCLQSAVQHPYMLFSILAPNLLTL